MLRLFFLICVFTITPAYSEDAPKRHALLIAVTQYRHAEMNRPIALRYPEADAKSLGEFLADHGYTVDYLLGKKATGQAIRQKLKNLKSTPKKSPEDEICLIGFWGHGVEFADKVEPMFCPWDTKMRVVKSAGGKSSYDRKGNLRFEPDPKGLIPVSEISRSLETCGAGNRIILASFCRDSPYAATNPTYVDLPKGTALVMACSRGQKAFENVDWGHGAMTKAMLSCLPRLVGTDDSLEKLLPSMREEVLTMVSNASNRRDTQEIDTILTGTPKLKLSEFTNQFGMQFKVVPQQSNMADGGNKNRRQRPLFVGVHEVTREQYRAVMKKKPWKEESGKQQYDNCPATNVTWHDAVAFCRRLSEMDKREYRLPTDEEWRMACSGGVQTKFHFGETSQRLEQYAWVKGNSKGTVRRVGLKKPNPFGLFDTYGNVWEWAGYSPYFSGQEIQNRMLPPTLLLVVHGGYWDSVANEVNQVREFSSQHRSSNIGFRVVFTRQKIEVRKEI